MKVQKILNNYFHNNIKKSAGDWDDITNVSDIADSYTNKDENPFEKEFWDKRLFRKSSISDLLKEQDEKNLNVIA